jgi:cell division protein FtsX
MSTTQAEPRNETKDVRQEIQDLKKAFEVQAATEAGAHATQAATHAGTWSTMLAGGAGLVVGMFLALALTATRS